MFSWWQIYLLLPATFCEIWKCTGTGFLCYQTYWKTTDMIRLGGFMCFISQWHHDRWECSAKKSQNFLTLRNSQTNHMYSMSFNLYNDLNIIQTQGRKKILNHQACYSKTFDSEQNTKLGFTNYLNEIVWYPQKNEYVLLFSHYYLIWWSIKLPTGKNRQKLVNSTLLLMFFYLWITKGIQQ